MKRLGLIARHSDKSRVSPAVIAGFTGVVLLPLVLLVLIQFRSVINSTDAALILVVIIVAIATTGHRVAGVLSALSASTWFDFFFTKPFEHFAINKSADVETTVLLLVVGVAVTELAVQTKRQRRIAHDDANYIAMIHDFSEMVSSGEPAQFIVIRAAAELSDLLSLRDCRFEESPAEKLCPRLESGGEVIVAGKRWQVNDIGLPNPEVELLVESQGVFLGRFVMKPTTGQPISSVRRVVAVAIAGQVGAGLASQQRGT